jgi:E3 ubiquitin-protein ligase synoviolin
MFGILLTIDALMLDFAIESVLTHGVSGIVLFGSEYAILLASLLNSILKYYVMLYDIRRARSRGGEDAPVWENKSMYMFYIELVTGEFGLASVILRRKFFYKRPNESLVLRSFIDFLKLTTYLAFFTIVMTFFGLPLNIIRDVYMTGVSFYTRFRDLLRYRAATKDMETKYPNATEAELVAMSDRTCIICREDMSPNAPRIHAQPPEVALGPNGLPQPGQTLGLRDPPKKLPCGHVFHFQCLRSWLERQQSCPTCRRSVLEPSNANADNNAAAQQRQQQQQRPGLVLPPVPRLPPPPVPGVVPAGVPAAPAAGGIAGARVRGGAAAVHLTARSRSPAGAVAPRAFQGFSVGGEWHAWPVSGPAEDGSGASPVAESSRSATTSHVAAQAEEDTGSAGTATPTVVATSATDSPPETAIATAAEPSPVEAASDPVQNKSPQEPGADSSSGVPPREAAAAAALRRLNSMASSFTKSSNPASPVTKSDSTSPTSGEQQQQPCSTPSPTRTTTLPQQILSTSASTSANSTSTTSAASFSSQPSTSSTSKPSTSKSASPPPSKPTSLPTLIPLFDPSSVANRPFINLSNIGLGFDMTMAGPLTGGAATPGGAAGLSSRARTYSTSSLSAFAQANSGSFAWSGGANAGPARTPAGSVSSTPMRVPSITSLTSLNPSSNPPFLSQPHLSRTSSSYFADPPEAPVAGAATTPLQIPSVLTDEVQMRRLDAWTREAIDERLRVLEDVQQSLWRAAAELQRVRGALPPTPTSTTNQQLSPIVSSASAKGKGRAVFDVQEEDEEADVVSGGAATYSATDGSSAAVDPPFP